MKLESMDAAIRGCVSGGVRVLQRGGCSSCCCGRAGSRWRSNWGASPSSPSVYLRSSWSCPRHPSSTSLCVAGGASSSSPGGPPCCTARSSCRRDSAPRVWILPPSSPTSSSNRAGPPDLAGSPSPTRRCTRGGCPVSAGRRPCSRGRCGGWVPPSGRCSRWTGWTAVGLRLFLGLALCGTTSWGRAGLWAAGWSPSSPRPELPARPAPTACWADRACRAPAGAAGEAAACSCRCDEPTDGAAARPALSPGSQGSPRPVQSRTCCSERYHSCDGEVEGEGEGEGKNKAAAGDPWAAAAWESWQSSAWKGRLSRSLQPEVEKV